MNKECTLQLFLDSQWHDVAGVMLLSPPETGWQAHTYTGYAVEWAVEWAGRRDSHALGSQFPVGIQPWNLAFGNKDNHARNPALQRFADGRIRLTPLFDFAPMYLHPDGIARRMRWKNKEGNSVDWNGVLDEVSNETGLARVALAEGMRTLLPPLRDVLDDADGFGLEPDVHAFLAKSIQGQLHALEHIR